MSGIYNQTITAVQNSMVAFCRYITANDIGETGSHQSGFYIPKYAIPVHGEFRHLKANAELAQTLGIPKENVLRYASLIISPAVSSSGTKSRL